MKAPFLAPRYRKGAFMYLGCGLLWARSPLSVKASLRDPESLKEAFTDFSDKGVWK